MKICILTEGGANIGFGHITRCTSIYQAFEEYSITPLMIVNGDDSTTTVLNKFNHIILNWHNNKKKLFNLLQNHDVVIIDSYLADKILYKEIANKVKIAVYIDDTLRIDYPAGIIINPALNAQNLPYPKHENVTTYLLGSQYAMMRKPFWETRTKTKNIKEEIHEIMVTFGGDDARNMTPKVINLIKDNYPNIKINAVIGKGFKHTNEIKAIKHDKINLIFNPDGEEMKNIMLNSDVAISAGGQTLYELARVGLPAIAVLVAENQRYNVEQWQKIGSIEYAGSWNDKDIINNITKLLRKLEAKKIREDKSSVKQSIIDGQGVKRIAKFILGLHKI
jgi:UDP-2,4-diacetamido-2,4,6-trideoxy-beta-L-altropyranose hydrolase